MLKFSEFHFILEKVTHSMLSSTASEIKNLLKDEVGEIYVVPSFDTFKRDGEPVQQSILFSTKNLNSFSTNYTMDGKLYSIDFWKSSSTSPDVTMYINKGSLEDVIKIVPEVLKNPVVKESLSENESKADVKFSAPKPTTEMDPMVNKAQKELEGDYEYGDPSTIFKDLETYIDMIIKGIQPSLLITGSPGVGKTFLVTSQLKKAGLKPEKDFIHLKGRSTAAGMYISLYEHNGKLLIFDDCDSVFGTADGVNVLKGALDSYGEREIAWLSGKPLKTPDGREVPSRFIFTGRVIFISNLAQKKIDDAIKSRSFVIEVALSPEDMLKRMRELLPKVHPEVPLALKEEAMDFIEKAHKTVKNLELNMRTLVKSIKILQEVDNLSVARRLILQQCSYK